MGLSAGGGKKFFLYGERQYDPVKSIFTKGGIYELSVVLFKTLLISPDFYCRAALRGNGTALQILVEADRISSSSVGIGNRIITRTAFIGCDSAVFFLFHLSSAPEGAGFVGRLFYPDSGGLSLSFTLSVEKRTCGEHLRDYAGAAVRSCAWL